MKHVIICGYHGFANSGDEALLKIVFTAEPFPLEAALLFSAGKSSESATKSETLLKWLQNCFLPKDT